MNFQNNLGQTTTLSNVIDYIIDSIITEKFSGCRFKIVLAMAILIFHHHSHYYYHYHDHHNHHHPVGIT